jgi:hypothetical protein
MNIAGVLAFAVAVVVTGLALHRLGRRAQQVDLGVVSNQWINEQRMQNPNSDR